MRAFDISRRTTPDGQEIKFWTHDIRESDAVFSKLKTDKPVDVTIKNKRIKRSLTANGYCWALCEEIAKAIHSTKEEVYRHHIHDVGSFTEILVKTAAVPDFISYWESNGIGWFADVLKIYNQPGYRELHMYHGSSQYDTEEMSRLIDSLVEEAKELDIVIMPTDDIERLKDEWGVTR